MNSTTFTYSCSCRCRDGFSIKIWLASWPCLLIKSYMFKIIYNFLYKYFKNNLIIFISHSFQNIYICILATLQKQMKNTYTIKWNKSAACFKMQHTYFVLNMMPFLNQSTCTVMKNTVVLPQLLFEMLGCCLLAPKSSHRNVSIGQTARQKKKSLNLVKVSVIQWLTM